MVTIYITKTNTLKPFSYSAGSLLSEKRWKGHESLLYDLFERISSYKQALMVLVRARVKICGGRILMRLITTKGIFNSKQSSLKSQQGREITSHILEPRDVQCNDLSVISTDRSDYILIVSSHYKNPITC